MKLILAWLSPATVFLSMVLTATAETGFQPGRVVAWGSYYDGTTFQPVWVPAGLTNAIDIAGGAGHSLALLPDGTVRAWGYNYYGQTNVPPGLDEVRAISAGQYFSLALRADGTVVGWGQYYDGSGFVPVSIPIALTNVVAVAAGASHGLSLNQDGTVTAWGDDSFGQADVPAGRRGTVQPRIIGRWNRGYLGAVF
jgi:alpha-tubulin suppressor-like RCC1 family protein